MLTFTVIIFTLQQPVKRMTVCKKQHKMEEQKGSRFTTQ